MYFSNICRTRNSRKHINVQELLSMIPANDKCSTKVLKVGENLCYAMINVQNP